MPRSGGREWLANTALVIGSIVLALVLALPQALLFKFYAVLVLWALCAYAVGSCRVRLQTGHLVKPQRTSIAH